MKPVFRIALFLPMLLVGCSGSPEAREGQIEQAASSLGRSSDADSLAAAALLTTRPHATSALTLIARARAAAPNRADLAWLHVRICAVVKDCNAEPIEADLRAIDSGNAAGWSGHLSRAHSLEGDPDVDRYLEAMGESRGFNIYWTTLSGHLAEAIVDGTAIAAPEAIVVVSGKLAAIAIPPYKAVSDACKAERLEREDIRRTCRAVAGVMQRGDAYITEMFGVSLAKRVWPAGSAELQAADEARRVYRYRTAIALDFVGETLRDERAAEHYLRLLAENRTEQDVLRAQIVGAGKSPDPPGDWTAGPPN